MSFFSPLRATEFAHSLTNSLLSAAKDIEKTFDSSATEKGSSIDTEQANLEHLNNNTLPIVGGSIGVHNSHDTGITSHVGSSRQFDTTVSKPTGDISVPPSSREAGYRPNNQEKYMTSKSVEDGGWLSVSNGWSSLSQLSGIVASSTELVRDSSISVTSSLSSALGSSAVSSLFGSNVKVKDFGTNETSEHTDKVLAQSLDERFEKETKEVLTETTTASASNTDEAVVVKDHPDVVSVVAQVTTEPIENGWDMSDELSLDDALEGPANFETSGIDQSALQILSVSELKDSSDLSPPNNSHTPDEIVSVDNSEREEISTFLPPNMTAAETEEQSIELIDESTSFSTTIAEVEVSRTQEVIEQVSIVHDSPSIVSVVSDKMAVSPLLGLADASLPVPVHHTESEETLLVSTSVLPDVEEWKEKLEQVQLAFVEERQLLQKECDRQKSAATAFEAQVQSFQKQLQALSSENSRLLSEKSIANSQISKLRSLEEALAAAKEQAREAEQRAEDTLQEGLQLSKQAGELSNLNKQLRKDNAELRERLAEIELQLQTSEASLSALRAGEDARARELEELRQLRAREKLLQSEVQSLQESVKLLPALRTRIAELESLSGAAEAAAAAQRTNGLLEEQVQSLQQELRKLRNSTSATDDSWSRRCSTLEATILRLRAQLEDAQLHHSQAPSTLSEPGSDDSTTAALSQSRIRQELEDVSYELKLQRETSAHQRHALEAELARLQGLHSASRASETRMQDEIRLLRRQLVEKETLVSDLQARLALTEASVADSTREAALEREKLVSAQREAAEFAENAEKAAANVKQLSESLTATTSRLEAASHLQGLLRAENAQLEAQVDSLTAKIAHLEASRTSASPEVKFGAHSVSTARSLIHSFDGASEAGVDTEMTNGSVNSSVLRSIIQDLEGERDLLVSKLVELSSKLKAMENNGNRTEELENALNEANVKLELMLEMISEKDIEMESMRTEFEEVKATFRRQIVDLLNPSLPKPPEAEPVMEANVAPGSDSN